MGSAIVLDLLGRAHGSNMSRKYNRFINGLDKKHTINQF